MAHDVGFAATCGLKVMSEIVCGLGSMYSARFGTPFRLCLCGIVLNPIWVRLGPKRSLKRSVFLFALTGTMKRPVFFCIVLKCLVLL